MRRPSARRAANVSLEPQDETMTNHTHNRLTVGDGIRFGFGMMLVPFIVVAVFMLIGRAGITLLPPLLDKPAAAAPGGDTAPQGGDRR